jgi:cell wall-active antibiotic response 4TMS protein YvqF
MTEPADLESPTPPADERARKRVRDERSYDTIALVWGGIMLVVGIWFFLDQTLGINMPSVNWGDFWPVILIIVGAFVIFRGMRRRTG